MTAPFMLRAGSIYAVPVAHYTLEFAVEVKRALDVLKPDCVAVELPETIHLQALHGASRLPDISVIQADDLYYMCEPCDAACEGLRWALEHAKGAFCIDLAVAGYPEYHEPLPDPYAIHSIGLEAYYKAYATTSKNLPKGPLDQKRELYMARRLKELSLQYDTILFVGGMFHAQAVLDLVSNGQFQTDTHHTVGTLRLVTLTEDARREVMAECGWFTAAYEAWRAHPERVLDRQNLVYQLYKQAGEKYSESTGNAFMGYHLRNTMKFVRNYALIHNRLLPNLFELLAAAKGCVDHNYAYETWLLATEYPHFKNIDSLPEMPLSVEEVWGHPKQIRFHLKQKRRKGHEFHRRPKDRSNMRLRPPSPFGICSYPPEDLVIENFGDFLKKKGNILLSEEAGKVVPFTTSLEDGIDTRETIRHIYNRQLYVKVKGHPPGAAGSVVVIFDSDCDEEKPLSTEKFPWRTTWHGEHTQESDMAFYATHLAHNVVGPGISRCEYGGFLMSYPPRRMLDIWNDPDYLECRTKAEVLLMAAIDYALKPLVVYVSEKPPRSKMKSFAARFGKKIVYIPLGQLSPVLLNKIRVFHVLDGYDKREIAGDYIF